MQKAKKRLFSVTAVLLAVLVALTALLPTAGAAQAATMKSKYTGKSYTHNARFDKLEVLNGVDISAWQEKVDWKKIKNDGIDFAILRAGYGKNASQEDAYFATNFKNATAAGLPVGIYWYSYAKSVADVEKEARLCLQVLGSRTLDLPVFYDLEESSQLSKGKAFCTQLVEHFCSIIAAKKQTKRLATTTARSFVFKGSGAKPGTKYYFYVAPYTVDSKTKEGGKGTRLATTTRPTATKCTAAKSAKKQQITVRWNKVKCNGYAVQYSTKKNFSGDKKTLYVSSGKAAGNIKTAKGGRTYYVRLRPYSTVGNTRYYGSYTAARAVRVK